MESSNSLLTHKTGIGTGHGSGQHENGVMGLVDTRHLIHRTMLLTRLERHSTLNIANKTYIAEFKAKKANISCPRILLYTYTRPPATVGERSSRFPRVEDECCGKNASLQHAMISSRLDRQNIIPRRAALNETQVTGLTGLQQSCTCSPSQINNPATLPLLYSVSCSVRATEK